MIFVFVKTMSSRCGPWRGGFPGVENASADCRLFLLRKSKSIQLVWCVWLCHTKLFSKEIFGHFLLLGKQLLPNTPQPSEVLNENKISPEKSQKKDVVRAIGLKSQDDCDLIILQIIHIDSSPVSSNDDKRDYEKHIDAMAVEQIHQSTPPFTYPIFLLSPPKHLSATHHHSSKCSSVHWTAVSNQSTLHFIFYSSVPFVTACGLHICKWNHSIWQNLFVLRHPGVVAWLPVLMAPTNSYSFSPRLKALIQL